MKNKIAVVFLHGRYGVDTSCIRIANHIKKEFHCDKILIRDDKFYQWDDKSKYDHIIFSGNKNILLNYKLIIIAGNFDGNFFYECKDKNFTPYWMKYFYECHEDNIKIISYIGSKHESKVYWGEKVCDIADAFICPHYNQMDWMRENQPELFHSKKREKAIYEISKTFSSLLSYEEFYQAKDVVFVARKNEDKMHEAFKCCVGMSGVFNLVDTSYKNYNELKEICKKSYMSVDFSVKRFYRRMQNCQVEAILLGKIPVVSDVLDPTYGSMIEISGETVSEVAVNFSSYLESEDMDYSQYVERMTILRKYVKENFMSGKNTIPIINLIKNLLGENKWR